MLPDRQLLSTASPGRPHEYEQLLATIIRQRMRIALEIRQLDCRQVLAKSDKILSGHGLLLCRYAQRMVGSDVLGDKSTPPPPGAGRSRARTRRAGSDGHEVPPQHLFSKRLDIHRARTTGTHTRVLDLARLAGHGPRLTSDKRGAGQLISGDSAHRPSDIEALRWGPAHGSRMPELSHG